MLIEVIELDNLSVRGVSVKTQKIYVDNGIELLVGDVHRVAYMNSERGRLELQSNLQEPYLTSVLNVWGENPVIDETNVL